jgi:hypothetical protein
MSDRERPPVFLDLPLKSFPVVMKAYRKDTAELIWEATLDGASVVYVPPLWKEYGAENIWTCVASADGQYYEFGRDDGR